MLKVSFSVCELRLKLSYCYLYAVLFLQLLNKSREMRAVVEHNGRKGVELSHAIGIFLIYDI